jgi:hypothetical protein
MSTITFRAALGATLLTTGLAGATVLTAAPPAAALASQVCVAWTSSGHGYIDEDGNDIYVIEARCSMWMSTGGGDDEAEKDHEEVPGGASPDTEDKVEHCEFLKEQLEAQRAALAVAEAGIQAADDEVDRLNIKAGADRAAYLAAHEEYLRALAELENAKAHYREESDTEVEYETRNGNTVVVRLAVDPNRPWGEVVIAAQEQLDRARAAERAAWEAWSRGSSPDVQAAQADLDALRQVLATAPMHIGGLQRDLDEDC